MTISSAAILLFLVMDPLGNIPLFVAALRNVDPSRRRRVIARELVVALAILMLFLLTGSRLLELLHISQPSLGIAGGIVLFLIALHMVFPGHEMPSSEDEEDPFIVPLAVPALAGPSTMATILLLATREPERRWEWLIALGLAWLGAALILFLSADLSRALGPRGVRAVERLMGMLLIAVAVEMTLDGIRLFLA